VNAEHAKQTAKRVLDTTDQSLQAMANINRREYNEPISSLRFAADQIPGAISSVLDTIKNAREKLENCHDGNLLVDDVLKAMPADEVSALRATVSDIQGGIGFIKTKRLEPAEERLGTVKNTVDAAQEYASAIDSLAPDPDGPESSWTTLRFACKTLKRVWGAI
jgi:hypothetical protein